MAVVSGSELHGTTIGNDFHDHDGTLTVEGLEHDSAAPPPDALVLTRVQPFHNYPSFAAFTPYAGEVGVEMLGATHTHRVNTRMEGVPPTFPVRFCERI